MEFYQKLITCAAQLFDRLEYLTSLCYGFGNVETDPKKPGQVEKLSTNKKSIIFELSSCNLVKMTNPLCLNFALTSKLMLQRFCFDP